MLLPPASFSMGVLPMTRRRLHHKVLSSSPCYAFPLLRCQHRSMNDRRGRHGLLPDSPLAMSLLPLLHILRQRKASLLPALVKIGQSVSHSTPLSRVDGR